jgi:hypothetical protein
MLLLYRQLLLLYCQHSSCIMLPLLLLCLLLRLLLLLLHCHILDRSFLSHLSNALLTCCYLLLLLQFPLHFSFSY